ncbi:hypothetical protein MHB42_20630 [Lysinibacillus sp. FSL K6-0232]|uniref:hypothetical protein n=1 Tax=Lysinibacillus sp. FSL K6-0232 TaxID=2921425 RepID=UPI0030F852AE
MVKDKTIKMRASAYDKAVLKAIAAKVDQERSFAVKTSESDVLRIAISNLVLQYLTDDEIVQLKSQYMFQ